MRPPRLSAWPPLPIPPLLPRPRAELPFPLEDERCRIFARARHALFAGLGELGVGEGDELLVPAYHHGSEIEAIQQTGAGLRWYGDQDPLAPDEAELEALLGPATRALYLIHYFGFPQDAARWRRWCDRHGLLLIEDAAQAWLATGPGGPVGTCGDLTIFCLYKSFGVPEGAALLSGSPPSEPGDDPRFGAGVLARRFGAYLAQRSGTAHAALDRFTLSADYSPERDLALGDPRSKVWASVGPLLRRLADPHAAALRRSNYAVLAETLGECLPPAFADPGTGAAPFVFPFRAERKDPTLSRLRENGVLGLDLWSTPHPALPAGRFERAGRLRAELIGLPVHQELSADDLRRISEAARPAVASRAAATLEPLGDLAGLADEWEPLAEASQNVFATHGFALAWVEWAGVERHLELLGWRDARGRLRAIAPLYRYRSHGLRGLRTIGHGAADQLDLICAPADRVATAAALRSYLAAEAPDICLLDRMPEEAAWDGLLGGRVLHRQSSPVLEIEGRSWEELLSGWSSNLRGQVRRRERKLVRELGLVYRLCDDPARLGEDLDVLFGLHDARWNDASSGFSAGRRALHARFARHCLERGWLRLWIAEAEGRPVAAWYGFRFGDSDWYYQAGRDPDYASTSIGSVLLAHTIRDAAESGIGRYRFLLGEEDYKYRFANRDDPVDTVALAATPKGAAAVLAATAAARSPRTRRAVARIVADPARAD